MESVAVFHVVDDGGLDYSAYGGKAKTRWIRSPGESEDYRVRLRSPGEL